MNEILELQTGQVSFISGLMAGFSLSISAQIIRSNAKGPVATAVFILFTISSLLFLIALYIDVALSLRIAGVEQFAAEFIERISFIRQIGTSAATAALFLFIVSIGFLGWLQSRVAGITTATAAFIAFIVIWFARSLIFEITPGI